MLQVAANGFSYKSKIRGRALIHCIIKRRDIYTKLRTHKENSSAKARAASRHVGRCNARACQLAVQCSTVPVQCSSLFLNKRTSFFTMNETGIDACFECQNDVVSKIPQVTDTHTHTTSNTEVVHLSWNTAATLQPREQLA